MTARPVLDRPEFDLDALAYLAKFASAMGAKAGHAGHPEVAVDLADAAEELERVIEALTR